MPALKVRYSRHLELRLKVRGVPRVLPRTVFAKASHHYIDRATGFSIAVHRIRFQGKQREICLVYRREGNEILFITIHPLKAHQLENRIESGRWRIIAS